MNHASLFSGIGGFDLAAEWMGWENVFHCEKDDFPRTILKYYWPNADSLADIKKVNFTRYANKVDVLTGGFPCQPYSHAGKRLGKEDDRHLWPEMLRAIREIRPGWVVAENVYGLINWNRGLVFEEVQTDLEAEEYEVQSIILPACGKNAPHKRDRIWFVAYRANTRNESMQRQGEDGIYGFEFTSDTQSLNKQRNGLCEKFHKGKVGRQDSGVDRKRTTSYTRSIGRIQNNIEQQSKKFKPISPRWEWFPTQSPVCSRDDGISSRLDGITFPKWRRESIKAYGNAIVPQVAYEIFKVINTL